MLMNVNGACFCKRIQFTITGEIPPPWNCYCENCRKLHGSAFATHTVIKKANFQWLKGEEIISRFAPSPNNFRHFCSHCGSQLVIINDSNPDIIVVVYAALDAKKLLPPIGHLFTSSKVCWLEIKDAIPQYDKLPLDDIWNAYAKRWLS